MTERLVAENKRLRSKLEKVAAFMDRLAAQSERQVEQNAGRFDSLAEASRADAKNWKATAADIRKALEP